MEEIILKFLENNNNILTPNDRYKNENDMFSIKRIIQ